MYLQVATRFVQNFHNKFDLFARRQFIDSKSTQLKSKPTETDIYSIQDTNIIIIFQYRSVLYLSVIIMASDRRPLLTTTNGRYSGLFNL